jgi:uncharacterized protein (DUF2236 family)
MIRPMAEPQSVATQLDVRDHIEGIGAVLAGTANVIMQLSWPAVGYGVMESTVESGRIFDHPLKRGRTTLSFLAVAIMGDDADRAAYRRAINSAHVHVHSTPESPVAYNAFDPELQLWVAACLSYGARDSLRTMRGPLGRAEEEALYRETARFGTTLQVTSAQWPGDLAAFEAYWADGLGKIDIDETTRDYLLSLLDSKPFPWFLRLPTWRLMRFTNTGFLPPEFREALGLTWSEEQERRFRRLMRWLGRLTAMAPRPLRIFPFNAYLWDVRRRVRQGRALV